MMRFAFRTQWIATGLRPRDDKLVKEWSVDYDDYTHSLSLRGGNESDRRGNPSCLDERVRLVSSLTGSQWIATGLRPRDDKVVKEWSVDYDDIHVLCHCEERTK